MKQLKNLEASEVSLVPVGANRKRFLVLKEGQPEQSSALDRIVRTIVKNFGKKDDDDKLNEKLDGLSPAAQTAARAIGRIAAPHADELTGDHVKAVLSEAGIGGAENTEPNGGSKMKKEHMESAKKAAEDAYKETMKKLGYQKYPEGKLQMKEVTDNAEKMLGGSERDEGEEKEKEKAAKAEKEKAMKEYFKADGSIDVEAVAKSTDADPVLVAIAKMHAQAESRVKAAETKASETERVLKEHRESVRKEELVRKAKEFKHLRLEDVQKSLELADKAGAEEYTRVVKMFESMDAQIAKGNLFAENGSAGMSAGSGDAWTKIEKAADGIVQKSAEKITKEMAGADFLNTPEGMELYTQHQAARPNGI